MENMMPRKPSHRTTPPLDAETNRAVRSATRHHFTRRGQLVGGPACAIFIIGGRDLFDWLSKQTPEGSTISETLAAIALDEMRKESDEAEARGVF
ncbi:MAG: hypothetical protein ACJAZ1_002084 [Yoonia sp.]|jgi:hypothetical protein